MTGKSKILRYSLYQGKSMIANRPIQAILRTQGNKKTDRFNAWELWILPMDIGPSIFNGDVANNAHESVCGDCKHGGRYTTNVDGIPSRDCYVNAQGVNSISKAAHRNSMHGSWDEFEADLNDRAPKIVRVGSWGDGAVLPIPTLRKLFKLLARYNVGHTAYTHTWQRWAKDSHREQFLKRYFMASVDTIEEYHEATSRGYRTFGVFPDKVDNLVLCPASDEAGNRTTCAHCALCDGTSTKDKRPSIYIPPHGAAYTSKKSKEEKQDTLWLKMIV